MTSENVYTEIVAERGAKVIPDLLRGNAGNVGEIGALLDLSADEIDRLRATVERLLRYAYHEEECQVMKWNGGIVCDCGYDELTAALATPSEESKCKTY